MTAIDRTLRLFSSVIFLKTRIHAAKVATQYKQIHCGRPIFSIPTPKMHSHITAVFVAPVVILCAYVRFR